MYEMECPALYRVFTVFVGCTPSLARAVQIVALQPPKSPFHHPQPALFSLWDGV